jgi:nitrogen-specific signal transduction histidine kinase
MSNNLVIDPIIHNLPVAILVVDKERKVMLSNKAAEFLANKSESQLFDLYGGQALGCIHADSEEGCGFTEHCDACDVKNAVLETFLSKKDRESFDTKINLKLYGSRDIKVSATYLNLDEIRDEIVSVERRISRGRRESDLRKEMVIVAMEDVTEFKKKERMSATLETVGALCHEMNQPLQVLEGSLSLIKLDLDSPKDKNKEINENLKIAYEAQVKLAKIISDLKQLKEYETKQYLSGRILDIEKSANSGELS